MTDIQIFNEISSLPEDIKKEVSDFILFLKFKKKMQAKLSNRKFGHAKGFFQMTEDFDKPLDDFKEYM